MNFLAKKLFHEPKVPLKPIKSPISLLAAILDAKSAISFLEFIKILFTLNQK